MNGSTEVKPQAILSTWQFKFFVACVLIALVVVARTFHFAPLYEGQRFYLSMTRHLVTPVEAGRITVANGIRDFSGRPPEIIGWTPYLKVFIALWFTFVAVPTAWILLRKNRERRKANGERVPFLMSLGIGLTAVWCILFPLSIAASFFAARSVYSTMQQDNALARYRNDVTDHLSMISYTVQQYYILPSPEGGDGGSFTKKNTLVSLSGLGFKEKNDLGRFILYNGGNDTTMQLLFIGNRITDHDRQDPRIGYVVEYETVITPHRFRITMKQ